MAAARSGARRVEGEGPPTLLLASGSPRRREILTSAGFRFRVVAAPEVEESHLGRPAAVVVGNARAKCRAYAEAHRVAPGAVVLGADTVVAIDGQVLGKPRDRRQAGQMLRGLSGRWHRVLTGLWLRDGSGREARVVTTTRVHMLPLAPAWIRGYLRSGEADDKAGAYGIQGRMAGRVDRISGCYFNVVGLSPASVGAGLIRLGWSPVDFLC